MAWLYAATLPFHWLSFHVIVQMGFNIQMGRCISCSPKIRSLCLTASRLSLFEAPEDQLPGTPHRRIINSGTAMCETSMHPESSHFFPVRECQ
jgi:hypothetical protein